MHAYVSPFIVHVTACQIKIKGISSYGHYSCPVQAATQVCVCKGYSTSEVIDKDLIFITTLLIFPPAHWVIVIIIIIWCDEFDPRMTPSQVLGQWIYYRGHRELNHALCGALSTISPAFLVVFVGANNR